MSGVQSVCTLLALGSGLFCRNMVLFLVFYAFCIYILGRNLMYIFGASDPMLAVRVSDSHRDPNSQEIYMGTGIQIS